MDTTLIVALAAGGLLLVGVVAIALSFRRVEAGRAMIVHKMGGEPMVTFSGGAVVLPIVHRVEYLDIGVKTLKVRCGGVRTADETRVDIEVTCFFGVNHTKDDVLRVAQSIGCARASHPTVLEELFLPKVSDVIATVAATCQLAQMLREREVFKDHVIEMIGRDLNGYCLNDLTIDHIEAAGLAAHDPEGRGRAEQASSEVARLRRDLQTLQQQFDRLVERLAAAKVLDGERV